MQPSTKTLGLSSLPVISASAPLPQTPCVLKGVVWVWCTQGATLKCWREGGTVLAHCAVPLVWGRASVGCPRGHGDRLEIPVLPLERRSASQGKNRCRMFGRDFQVTRVKTPCLISLSILRVLCPTVQPQGREQPGLFQPPGHHLHGSSSLLCVTLNKPRRVLNVIL